MVFTQIFLQRNKSNGFFSNNFSLAMYQSLSEKLQEAREFHMG